jgi:hypothetical protein
MNGTGEIIMLCKISQTQKENDHIFSHMQNLDLKKKKNDMNVKNCQQERGG